MASLGMGKTCYRFNRDEINTVITRKCCGNYALGYIDDDTFIVKYVGRADLDVRERLLQHINEDYESFKFSYATSPKDAFEKECKNYHDFNGDEGKLDNKIHPDRPSNSKNWKCPCCNNFDD